MNLAGASRDLIRAGFGESAASVAHVGPLALVEMDVGRDDMILRHGQERTSWANPARDSCDLWGKLTSNCDRSVLGLVPAKSE